MPAFPIPHESLDNTPGMRHNLLLESVNQGRHRLRNIRYSGLINDLGGMRWVFNDPSFKRDFTK